MARYDNNINNGELAFYPAFCFKASPTHFSWVKMSAVDLHRLQARKEFEGQHLFFYHNHPIQFVCLVGIIVSREEYPRRTIFILDDSSGATVEIVIHKSTINTRHSNNTGAISVTETTNAQTSAEAVHVASTSKSPLDVTALTLGAIVKVKGTLASFRSTVQVVLERFFILPDTNAETRFWDERSRYLVEVLSIPWSLTAPEVAQLQCEAEEEGMKEAEIRKRAREKQKRLAEREEKDHRRIQRRWEREERLRERQTVICQEINGKRPEVVTMKHKGQ